MQIMEDDFSCTGLFNPTAYYLFTNINSDVEQIGTFPSCANFLENTIEEYGKRIA